MKYLADTRSKEVLAVTDGMTDLADSGEGED
jgi:hypothetical protein